MDCFEGARQMTRRELVRAFFIAVIGALVAGLLATIVSGQLWIGIIVAVVAWVLIELSWPRFAGRRLRWPVERVTDQLPEPDEASDYGAQVATLMMMPLDEAPLIRARVAKLFAPFQLSNAERSVLVRWATFPLDGTELKYEIEPIPGWDGRFRVRCYINYSPEPLTGAIESSDAHRIVEAHKTMVARLLEERRPGQRPRS
jgi:hypothetical protein